MGFMNLMAIMSQQWGMGRLHTPALTSGMHVSPNVLFVSTSGAPTGAGVSSVSDTGSDFEPEADIGEEEEAMEIEDAEETSEYPASWRRKMRRMSPS
jgi:hypothetical protein